MIAVVVAVVEALPVVCLWTFCCHHLVLVACWMVVISVALDRMVLGLVWYPWVQWCLVWFDVLVDVVIVDVGSRWRARCWGHP